MATYLLEPDESIGMEHPSFARVWPAYQAGDAEAKNRLLAAFIPRITGLIKKFLRNRRNREDVRQSVLGSVLAKRGAALADITSPEELWELFAAITLRHCSKHNKQEWRAAQRGPVLSLGGAATDSSESFVAYVPIDNELSPDVKAGLADLFAECNARLTDRQQNILGHLLAAFDRKEIAKLVGFSIPTVDREINTIKTVLADLAGERQNP